MKTTLVLVAALQLAPAIALAKGNLKPGNWHLKVTHEMVGLPYAPPPTEIDQCLTQQQADDPKSMVQNQNKDCDPAEIKVDGNKVSYKVTCHKNGNTQTGYGEMVMAGDSYTGTMTVEMDNPRMGHVKVVNHTTAQRTGDCPK